MEDRALFLRIDEPAAAIIWPAQRLSGAIMRVRRKGYFPELTGLVQFVTVAAPDGHDRAASVGP